MANLEGMAMKFTVIKNDDLKQLPKTLQTQVDLAGDMIVHNRIGAGKPENLYIVINTDEPYADEVIEIMKRHGHWG